MSEEKYKVLTDDDEQVEVSACGHPNNFEHRVVNCMFDAYEMGVALQIDPTDSAMKFLTELFQHYNMRVPTIEEMNANPVRPRNPQEVN